MTKYKQCTLQKHNLTQVCYIPDEYAHINSTLKIRENGFWSNGWKVVKTSCNLVDENNLPDSHKEIRGHRKMTGDAQSKDKTKREE